ncbi:PHB depolymerase family esterase [Tersicoccus sp. MR15.9]|uniref:alpha/beta hydrolase family esterase n=1 Tax=Tersicoccus mangrovi TaxID=3121635 RepID=UPI002FE57C45
MTQQTTTPHSIEVDGKERTFLLTAPAEAAGAPLVLVLHGSNQTSAGIRGFTRPGFDTLATLDGAVVAYPQGYRKHWNDARAASDFAARREGYDDVAFVRALIDELARAHGIDRSRVYAVGYSNGGQLAIRLAHEVPELLAGIALFGATQPVPEHFAPTVDRQVPLPVLMIHGTRDPNVPYAGGTASLFGFRPRGRGLSAPDTAAYWARRNGHAAGPTVIEVPGERADRTRVERTDHATPGLPPVRMFTVHGGGHVMPGDKPAVRILGRTSRRIRTVDEIARFFGLRAE